MKKLLFFVAIALLVVGALFLGVHRDASSIPPAVASASADLVADAPVVPLVACALVVMGIAATVPGASRRLSTFLRLTAAIAVNGLRKLIELALPPEMRMSLRLSVDDWTMLADLWVPEVLVEAMQEQVVERTSFLDSGVVVSSPKLAELASGPGTEATFPFIIEPNHADQQQKEDTAPDIKALSSGSQKGAFYNRVSTLGATALSNVISGVKANGDLLTVLVSAIKGLRSRQRNRLVLAQLAGLFDVTAAPNASTGAFKALRYDAFLEAGATPADDYLIDTTKMLYAAALLGENKEMLVGGAVIMHSQIEAALVDQDQIDVIKNSEGEIVMRRWKGMQVFISDLLVRNGGTNGKVYYTFLCGRGSIASGEKTQVITDRAVLDAAALQLDLSNVSKNNVAIYDRTRFLLHPQGAKWVVDNEDLSVPEAGPSNTEVADDASWALGAANIKNTRIVCIRTNG